MRMTLKEYTALDYTIRLKKDEEGDWIAEIEELEGCVAHGATREEAFRRIDEAKALWIEERLAHGQPIPMPEPEEEALPSGRWVQRTPRSLHKNLVRLAKVEGTSLNQLVTSVLSEHVGAKKSIASTTTARAAIAHYDTSGRLSAWAVVLTTVSTGTTVAADFTGTTGSMRSLGIPANDQLTERA